MDILYVISGFMSFVKIREKRREKRREERSKTNKAMQKCRIVAPKYV